jgi:hypothetical protein
MIKKIGMVYDQDKFQARQWNCWGVSLGDNQIRKDLNIGLAGFLTLCVEDGSISTLCKAPDGATDAQKAAFIIAVDCAQDILCRQHVIQADFDNIAFTT